MDLRNIPPPLFNLVVAVVVVVVGLFTRILSMITFRMKIVQNIKNMFKSDCMNMIMNECT